MSPLGNERHPIQNPLIKYATDIGWDYINPDDAPNLGVGNRLVFIKSIIAQNTHYGK